MRRGTARSRITITHHGSRITITKPTQIIQTTPLFLPDPLPEQLALPLLGVPVVLRSNATAVITVAAQALAVWRTLPLAFVAAAPPAAFAIIVHPPNPDAPDQAPTGAWVVRSYGDTFLAAQDSNLLTAHLATRSATAFVTPALVADTPHLRDHVIERLGFLLASAHDRTPIAAAGVVHNGCAVLLVGANPTTKALLSYACLQVGFSLLAATTVYVSLADGLRVWGHPGHLQLPPDAPRFFPELAALAPVGPKQPFTLDSATHWPAQQATHANRVLVCLLEPDDAQASRLTPLPRAEAVAALHATPSPELALLRARLPAALAALTTQGTYRLHVGADPHSAAALLTHLLAHRVDVG